MTFALSGGSHRLLNEVTLSHTYGPLFLLLGLPTLSYMYLSAYIKARFRISEEENFDKRLRYAVCVDFETSTSYIHDIVI